MCPDTFETVSGLKHRMIQFYEANDDTCIVKYACIIQGTRKLQGFGGLMMRDA